MVNNRCKLRWLCVFDAKQNTVVLCWICRCYVDYANHRQMALSTDGLVNLCNYTLFIAELMLAHKVSSTDNTLFTAVHVI